MQVERKSKVNCLEHEILRIFCLKQFQLSGLINFLLPIVILINNYFRFSFSFFNYNKIRKMSFKLINVNKINRELMTLTKRIMMIFAVNFTLFFHKILQNTFFITVGI